jgi:hypothetical protein
MTDQSLPLVYSTEWRRQVQTKQLRAAMALRDSIKKIDPETSVLDDEQLNRLNIRRLQVLDVDEEIIDFGPQYFRPFPAANNIEQLIDTRETADRWRLACQGSWEDEEFPPTFCECNRAQEAEFRLLWFYHALSHFPNGLLAQHTDWRMAL